MLNGGPDTGVIPTSVGVKLPSSRGSKLRVAFATPNPSLRLGMQRRHFTWA